MLLPVLGEYNRAGQVRRLIRVDASQVGEALGEAVDADELRKRVALARITRAPVARIWASIEGSSASMIQTRLRSLIAEIGPWRYSIVG